MLGKSRTAAFFQWFVVPDVRKVGSLKRRVLWREAHFEVKVHKTPHARNHFGSSDLENGTPLWREAHLQVKMRKTPHARSHFGSSDLEKWHAAVARSTFVSENAQNTTFPSHFWSADLEKAHVWVKMHKKKHILGPLFELQMSKNRTPLWREAHSQVKMYKTPHARTTFWSLRCRKIRQLVS